MVRRLAWWLFSPEKGDTRTVSKFKQNIRTDGIFQRRNSQSDASGDEEPIPMKDILNQWRRFL